ncbi:FMRFamide-related neuropeptides-like [Schistocerca piceifrons]|uniref:FMRFamide-related neuropeptides-like n=1 Tax=Schistocerca piceifrons TaxID=274613 RepID=UPI001F5F59CF|nr:FMRFamide-related neuropeptides-like [Schistocerca piceifrons]
MTPPALLLLLLLMAAGGALQSRADADAETTPRSNFLRLGRAGGAHSAFLRLGRDRTSSGFLRLGRGSERNFLRFGRSRQDGEEVADDDEQLSRAGRSGMADPLTRHDRNFIRFGRSGRSGPAQHQAGAEPALWAALLDPRLAVLPAPAGADDADVDGAAGSGRGRISTRSFLRLG